MKNGREWIEQANADRAWNSLVWKEGGALRHGPANERALIVAQLSLAERLHYLAAGVTEEDLMQLQKLVAFLVSYRNGSLPPYDEVYFRPQAQMRGAKTFGVTPLNSQTWWKRKQRRLPATLVWQRTGYLLPEFSAHGR
jgi:hypothetical protein